MYKGYNCEMCEWFEHRKLVLHGSSMEKKFTLKYFFSYEILYSQHLENRI